MTFAELIESARAYLGMFDYDHYPTCFQKFEADIRPLFDALTEENSEALAGTLIEDLSRCRTSLPRRAQRDAAFEQKQVLGLFLSPAAQRHSSAAQDFSARLHALWCREYPRNSYLEGNYEQILNGFSANLFGLPLGKYKNR